MRRSHWTRSLCALAVLLTVASAARATPAPAAAVAEFAKDIRPLLSQHCYDCHADGAKKGGVAFDEASDDAALVADHELWGKVQKVVRAGLMPPPPKREPLPTAARASLDRWIKYQAFALDPAAPDPGRVTLRRLNRVEYRNTVRDLLGVDFRADEEFPPDDTGHGFDNIADALSVSPLLLEKYLAAAQQVIGEAVPTVARVMPERVVDGRRFLHEGKTGDGGDGELSLSYYEPSSVTHALKLERPGTYRVALELNIKGRYAEVGFDDSRAEVTFRIDGDEVFRQDFGWEEGRKVRHEYERTWEAGEHVLALEVKPLKVDANKYGELEVQLQRVRLIGPADESHWVRPRNYERFFGNGEDESRDPAARRLRAAKLLGPFATRAYRRPVDAAAVERLVALAERVYGDGHKTFEAGVAHAMTAVLASPRFLYREEFTEPPKSGERFPLLDEYSLASRLSYFLWSSMPDAELIRLAGEGKLRAALDAQVKRMLADDRADQFIENFAGQWLQARDVDGVTIETRRVIDRETQTRVKYRNDGDRRRMRSAMRREVERYFEHVVRDDRSVLELIDSDYTFLNERLAAFYGIDGVSGEQMRRVTLPKDSPRGGILTSGAVLMVTSNPTRTSPVKRGMFVLENVLGTPPPPPPPNIPSLPDPVDTFAFGPRPPQPPLRELLAEHRENAACASCHNRMDPIGLAFENFNALGLWRDREGEHAIDAAGTLVTGQSFNGVRELKRVLVGDEHRTQVYACITEKLLTYALGRGVEHHDVETVDQIVTKLEQSGGRFSTLLTGVIDSAPFQRRRTGTDTSAASARD